MASGTPNELLQKALQHQIAGRFTQAGECYTQLLSERPDLPTSWYNLGYVERMSGHFSAALAAYGEALRRNVSQPEEVHLNRAVIYADHLRDDAAAERELNAALGIAPHYVPALLNLANLREDQGKRQDAKSLYEAVLAIEPENLLALARLAGLSSAPTLDHQLAERVRSAIASATTPVADKANLGFALGQLLDAAGDYDAAFRAYVDANRASRACASRPHYDRRRHEKYVDDLIAAPPVRQTSSQPDTPAPIFICGMFRSGSTLAEAILSAHPRITAGGELDILPQLADKVVSRLDAASAAAMAQRYHDRLREKFPAFDRITDKRPDNFLHIGLIKAMFPDARIVHTRRDPLDNCLSVYFLHLDHSMAYALDLEDIAHYYNQHRRLMAHWKTLYGDDILDLDYDQLVRDPEREARRLVEFCGLAWDERCLEFYRTAPAVKTASVWQVRQPIYTRSSGRWRHYEKHLQPLKAMLGSAV